MRNIFSLSNTINWVAMMHNKQFRKGTEVPYVAHVNGVASLLMTHGIMDDNILYAALLHDVVEDANVSIEIINDTFGETVGEYVSLLSEDNAKSWDNRKLHSIYNIRHMPIGAKWVKLADKVNSLEMMKSEIETEGINWDKFNKGYMHQKWYYTRFFQERAKML